MKPDARSFRLTDFTDLESSMEKFGKIQVRAEPYQRARALILEKTSVREDERPRPYVRCRSDQDEIDQRDQGCADAGDNQGVIGADVSFRIERWLLGHFGDLGQSSGLLCETGHIWLTFFAASSSGTGCRYRR